MRTNEGEGSYFRKSYSFLDILALVGARLVDFVIPGKVDHEYKMAWGICFIYPSFSEENAMLTCYLAT